MFKKFKLRGRIFLGFSIPVFLVLGFCGIVYSVSNQISETFKEVNRSQNLVIQTDEMVLRTSMMARQVRGYLLTKSEEAVREFDKQNQLYHRAVESVDKLIIDPNQKAIFRDMVELGKDYNEMSQTTFRLAREGKQKEAVELYIRESKIMVGGMDKMNQDFNAKQQEFLAEYTRTVNNSIQFLIVAAVLTAAISLVLCAAAASLIWGAIARTNRTINQTVSAIVSSSAQISATVEQHERAATQQAASVNQTTATMNELSASSRVCAEQAESSAAGARNLLSLAESSAAGARNVLNLAESSETGARSVLTLASGGTKTVGRTIEGMSLLKEKVGDIAEKIVQLSEQAGQISSITNIVSDLANQTNMLALNAAVEAVRAGEHGKGFGIVAGEIRKLADESKRSAQKIHTLVAGIQTAINSTVMVTDEGRKTAESAIALSQETAEAFTNVAEAINEVVLKSSAGVARAVEDIVLNNQQNSLAAIEEVVVSNQQISLTAKQQSVAIVQVVDAMNALNQGAVDTAAGITQTKIGIQKLNEAAQNLNAMV